MTQTRFDLPWNFPADWDAPDFKDGEMPYFAMQEGERIIGSQKALVYGGINTTPHLIMLKRGVACYRLGYLFETHRRAILDAIKRDRQEGGKSDERR